MVWAGRCQEGWRGGAACEECRESKTDWISPEGKPGSPNGSSGRHILFVFNTATPINLWDFSIVII